MRNKNRNILALEIGEHSIRFLRYNSKENVIDLVAINPIDPQALNEPAKLRDSIKNLINESGIQSKDVITCVRGKNASVKRFRTDFADEAPKDILKWEMSQHLPGGMGGFQFDFQKISAGAQPGGIREYLAVACRKAYVEEMLHPLRTADLKPVLIDVDVFALQNAFEYNEPDQIGLPALLLFGEMNEIRLVLCQDGMIQDSESVQTNGGSDDQSLASIVTAAAEKLVSYPANASFKDLKVVRVAGDIAGDENVITGLREKYTGASVEQMNPFVNLKVQKDLAAKIESHAPVCAIAAGLIIRGINS